MTDQEKARRQKRYACRRCGVLKSREEFVRDKRRQNGIFPWCKECHCAYQKIYREANPEVVAKRKSDYSRRKTKERQEYLGLRSCPNCEGPVVGKIGKIFCNPKCNDKYERLDMYDLRPAEFRELTKSGLCPLCKCKVKKWQIDHNHDTGETMGPVCHRCNQYLLAGSKHDVKIAERLVEFLKCSPVRKVLGERRYQGTPKMSSWHRVWLWTGKGPTDVDVDERVAA